MAFTVPPTTQLIRRQHTSTPTHPLHRVKQTVTGHAITFLFTQSRPSLSPPSLISTAIYSNESSVGHAIIEPKHQDMYNKRVF